MSGSGLIAPRDWDAVQRDFDASGEIRHAVLDGFLDPARARRLRESLLHHWAWRRKNWRSRHLHNRSPKLPELSEISEHLLAHLPRLMAGKDLVSHWAILYRENVSGPIHSDSCSATLSLWLTDDTYNEDPASGGLVLYDVEGTADLMPHEHLVDTSAAPYVARHSRGGKVVVPYRFNRAVLFDGCTFHQTDRLRFRLDGPASYRINVSFAFDDPEVYADRLRPYFAHRAATGRG